MDELIERVAEAIWKETPIADDRSHPRYRRMARAALDALTAAGWVVVKLPEPERDCTWTDHPEHVAEMVDAALGGLMRQEREIDYGLGVLGVEKRKQVRWVTGWTPEERSER